jgi:branched-chain amino acid transport system ATP-binding protein
MTVAHIEAQTTDPSVTKRAEQMTEPVLEVEGINVFYGPVQALRGVSLRVAEGEMVALLGANGAGKTTTLRTISGLLSPADGRIRLHGDDITGRPAFDLVGLGVAHLPEGRELFPELSVVENLRLGHWTRRHDRAGLNERIEWVMELLPRLRERADQAAGTMSGGEQQMLGVARSLMSRPRLLLVDELSLGLAPMIVVQLFETLEEVNRHGTAVLLVEQFVHLALEHTKRAYVLSKGEVVLNGASADLLASPDLAAAYLGETASGVDPHDASSRPARRSRGLRAKPAAASGSSQNGKH